MPSGESHIVYEVDDGVATITLNAPERLNAMRRSMAQDLMAALDDADADDGVRAIVVTGAGRAFCAGADLSEGAGAFAAGALESGEVPPDIAGEVALRIHAARKLVVGAINGPAVGFGATMTLPMDIRLASPAARFSFPFARRGITPDGCSSWFLPRVVGIDRALEWMVSGRMVEIDEAREAGLVRPVAGAEGVLVLAQELARSTVADSAPVSVAITRQLLWRMLGAEHPLEAHRAESAALFERGRSADAREGVAAFLEKRPASFPDRVSHDRKAPTDARAELQHGAPSGGMPIEFVAVKLAGGERHQDVASLRWREGHMGLTGEGSLESFVEWIDVRGGRAFVSGPTGKADIRVVQGSPPVLRAFVDGRETDDLLELPRY